LSTYIQKKVMSKLAGLQFTLQYKKWPQNTMADALSRVGQFFQISAVSSVVPVWVQEVINSYSVDPTAQELIQALAMVSPDEKGYSLHDWLIGFKGQIWVGDNYAL
jgi:hypothetical protein